MTVLAGQTQTLRVERPDFTAKLLIDLRNQRVRALSYQYHVEIAPFTAYLLELAQAHNLSKVVVCAHGSDWQAFLARGFGLEGRIEQYYHGAPGHYMACFLTSARQASERVEEKQALLQAVLEQPPETTHGPDSSYPMITATSAMAADLAHVYDRVFASYPSPLTDPTYIRDLIDSGDGVFLAAMADGQIASAAAAEIDHENGNAEITNCATLPDFRGEGLMARLVEELEAELDRREIRARYSMARALSPGMNLVLHRAGYSFRGRLINHAHIGGGFEDLNLWEQARQQ